MREPLKPFSFGAPYNLNPTTLEYSRPEAVFDYQAHFNYKYDKLELQGMDVARLHDYITELKVGSRLCACVYVRVCVCVFKVVGKNFTATFNVQRQFFVKSLIYIENIIGPKT